MNKPHLLHKGRRVTTDATLKDDLKASLAASRLPAVRLARLEDALATLNKNQTTVFDTLRELVRVQAALSRQVERVLHSMAAVVARAQQQIDLDESGVQ